MELTLETQREDIAMFAHLDWTHVDDSSDLPDGYRESCLYS
jgi:hypothetical protein